MKKTTDAIRIYTQRLQPQIRLLYRAAHAITGSRSSAEAVLHSGILRAFVNRHDWRERMSFREGVLRAVREEARQQIYTDAEWDWSGICVESASDSRLIHQLAKEAPDIQRLMVLRYGCSLHAKEIAQLTGIHIDQIRQQLFSCHARMERALQGSDAENRSFERFVTKELRTWMSRENSEPIDVGYFISTFEQEAAGTRQSGRMFIKAIKGMLITAGALLTAFIVWIMLVLMEM